MDNKPDQIEGVNRVWKVGGKFWINCFTKFLLKLDFARKRTVVRQGDGLAV